MAELAYAHDSGSCEHYARAGSSPANCTEGQRAKFDFREFVFMKSRFGFLRFWNVFCRKSFKTVKKKYLTNRNASCMIRKVAETGSFCAAVDTRNLDETEKADGEDSGTDIAVRFLR